MEADLQMFCGVDYGDRFRRKDDGRPKLTLRRLLVLVQHLPSDSAVASIQRDGKAHWSLEAHLLDDERMVLMAMLDPKTKPERHPERPKQGPAVSDPGRVRKLAAARSRQRDRARRIAAGEIT